MRSKERKCRDNFSISSPHRLIGVMKTVKLIWTEYFIIEKYIKSMIAVPNAWQFVVPHSGRCSAFGKIGFFSISDGLSFIVVPGAWRTEFKAPIPQVADSLVLLILVDHESFLLRKADVIVMLKD